MARDQGVPKQKKIQPMSLKLQGGTLDHSRGHGAHDGIHRRGGRPAPILKQILAEGGGHQMPGPGKSKPPRKVNLAKAPKRRY